ncbi:MAG: glycosyltransferase family 4 protein, partial [Planctomycetota bacterium]
MKVAINLVHLRPGKIGGAETYIRGLMQGFSRTASHHEFLLITAEWNHDTLADFPPHFRRRKVRYGEPQGATGIFQRVRKLLGKGSTPPSRPFWDVENVLEEENPDILFCPFVTLEPLPPTCPAVVTLHDLQHEYLPFLFTPQELAHRATFFRPSVNAADAVIAVSEFTRRSVVEMYDVDPGAVFTVHEAADEAFTADREHADPAEVRAKFGLPERFAVYPANTWKHKNHAVLLIALRLLREERGQDLHLVLTGIHFEGRQSLELLLQTLDLKDCVHFLGYLSRETMASLYQAASFLVFPSLFEGFGLPIVEAMASGAPVLASNATSIPEVAGEAALLFDPRSPEEICDIMAKALEDPGVLEGLRSKGRDRVKAFSWDRAAEETLEVFRTAIRRGAGKTGAMWEGIHPDGWVTRRARLRMRRPFGGGVLGIRGETAFPDAGAYPIEIECRMGGEGIRKRVEAPGAFS